jgi:hypothetical protein
MELNEGVKSNPIIERAEFAAAQGMKHESSLLFLKWCMNLTMSFRKEMGLLISTILYHKRTTPTSVGAILTPKTDSG